MLLYNCVFVFVRMRFCVNLSSPPHLHSLFYVKESWESSVYNILTLVLYTPYPYFQKHQKEKSLGGCGCWCNGKRCEGEPCHAYWSQLDKTNKHTSKSYWYSSKITNFSWSTHRSTELQSWVELTALLNVKNLTTKHCSMFVVAWKTCRSLGLSCWCDETIKWKINVDVKETNSMCVCVSIDRKTHWSILAKEHHINIIFRSIDQITEKLIIIKCRKSQFHL